MSLAVVVTALCGIAVCVFALHVEHEAETKTDYKAPCDLGEGMSCSKVFTSPWGRGYGLIGPLLGEDSPLNLPNPYFGLAFYVALLVKELVFPPLRIFQHLAFAATLLAVVVCGYLAYILTFVLEDFCAVCVSSYVINAVLLFLLFPRAPKKKTKAKAKKAD